jgi:alpha-N-acetylglucosaminidase
MDNTIPENTLTPGSEQIAAVRDVLTRLLGARAETFMLEMIPQENGHDVYEYECRNDIPIVRGTTGVAIARGAYDLLRASGHVHCSWEGNNVELPETFPDTELIRTVSPYKYRNFYNQCTFGYTTAYWGWDRWEQEIDWLALHGINLPLAMVGQESVWRMVWNEMGLTHDEIDEMFSGPAFLPWHRMGNIYRHNGPIPRSWHDKQVELQKKIISRMRALGMQPVAPGFAGYVPEAFQRVFPEADVKRMKAFAEFDEKCDSFVLGAKDPLFPEIGAKFIRKYKEVFGPVSFYLVDTFNEMIPPVGEDTRYDDLAEYGVAAYQSVKAGDPDGMWIMQGWMFSFDRKFWDNKSVQAFLSRIPDDHIIILDLECSRFPMWEDLDAFYGKHWMYSIVHNFGATNFPFGDLRQYAADPIRALTSPKKGNLTGFGIAPEGSETNSVVYELLCDMSWRETEPDLAKWLHEYSEDRYGACPAQLDEAWKILVKNIYEMKVLRAQRYMRRPNLLSDATPPFDHKELGRAIELFLACGKELGNHDLYRRDLIDMVLLYLGNVADNRLIAGFRAQIEGKEQERDQYLEDCFGLMRKMDRLMETRPEQRLSRLVNNARCWGDTEEEADYYDADAKMQITVWGGPILADYAVRAWSGVIRDFYIPRLRHYIETVIKEGEEAAAKEIVEWEHAWCRNSGVSEPPGLPEDPVAEAQALMEQYSGDLLNITGEPVGQWDPSMLKEGTYQELEWDVTPIVTADGIYTVNYQTTDGYNYIFIEWTALLENGREVCRDTHDGYTGVVSSKKNIYPMKLEQYDPEATYTIRTYAKGWDGTYSYGNVSLKKA